MAKKAYMALTNEEKFNAGIARTRWKSDKTLRAEDWFKTDSASRYMEGKTYERKDELTDDGGLLQEGTEEA